MRFIRIKSQLLCGNFRTLLLFCIKLSRLGAVTKQDFLFTFASVKEEFCLPAEFDYKAPIFTTNSCSDGKKN